MYSMHCCCTAYVLSDRTHVYVPLIPTHQISLLCVQNESHQSALKYSSGVLFTYFTMQQTPKVPFSIWLYLKPPENHLCFISFTCLSQRLPPWGSERFSHDGKQSTVCSISGRGGYWNNSAVISYVISKCLSFSSFAEQYSLHKVLIISNYKFLTGNHFISILWLQTERAEFICAPQCLPY